MRAESGQCEDGESVQMPFRFDMEEQAETWGFLPDPLDPVKLAGPLADAQGKASFRLQEIGAAWSGDYSPLATAGTSVLWEVSLDREPPATIRPIKPKVWVTRPLCLKRQAIYKLGRL